MKYLHAVLLTSALALASTTVLASPAAVLHAVPPTVSAQCPATIHFKGQINPYAKGPVKYQFVRSDGGTGPVVTANFPRPGAPIAVSTTWTLGKSYSGWVAIRILSPGKHMSNKAAFKLTCRPAPIAKPVIKLVRPYGVCKKKGMELYIAGYNFGANPGVLNARVAMGGQGVHVDLVVVAWTNTMIRAKIPNSPKLIGGKTYYVAVEKSNHTQWLSNFYQPITMCQ